MGYSYSLTDVVEYYELYIDLIKHWISEYGDRIYKLSYEQLTINQVGMTRKLIANLGLDWDEQCLSPQNNKRIVKTAAQQQIRNKVYAGSSEAWKKYEPFLDGAFDRLAFIFSISVPFFPITKPGLEV